VELARANLVMRRRILTDLMLSGVTVIDPEATYVDDGVKVGRDTTIYPGVHLEGETVIGHGCVIEEGVKITDSVIGAGSIIKSRSIIEESITGKGVVIGPLARLRPGNRLSDGVKIGNFVEVKNSVIGAGTKANHLSYLGDAEIGRDVNIGAGTITCNYDGLRKYKTRIGDGAFIGSDSQLVAPVKVGRNAYVGSGTTVTKDVPPGSLVVARAEERIKMGWVEPKGLLKKKGPLKKKGHLRKKGR
jgi:bifunctional UDP-N-acetylglucosamine pyrophosphorylase/glucosamine-1-phosphate N-acetyltransferase